MDNSVFMDGLLQFFCFIIVITFHEAAHAWTSRRCGDDTAALLGRISLNPVVHIDPIGTILIPFLNIFLSSAGSSFGLIGWGRAVPVNPARLKDRLWDGMLIAMAGPAMNIVVAFVALLLAKLGVLFHVRAMVEFCELLALVSLFLCFFNLLPIPPLDGSHVVRFLFRMPDEVFYGLCRLGPILLLGLVQFPWLSDLVEYPTVLAYALLNRLVGL